jgi:hypothetical protein
LRPPSPAAASGRSRQPSDPICGALPPVVDLSIEEIASHAHRSRPRKTRFGRLRRRGGLGEDNVNALTFYEGVGGRDVAEGVEVFDQKALKKVALIRD